MTPLSATRLPSMAYPRWRPVPVAVSRRLLRLRSVDYDLEARKGYTRRLDRLVRERRAVAAARMARRAAAKVPAAAAAAAGAAGAAAIAASAATASAAPGALSTSSGAGEVQQPDWGAYHPGVEAVNVQLQRLLAVAPGSRAGSAGALGTESSWSLPLKAYYGRRGEQLAAMSAEDVEKQASVGAGAR